MYHNIPEDVRRLAGIKYDERGRCLIEPRDFEHFAHLTWQAGYREGHRVQQVAAHSDKH